MVRKTKLLTNKGEIHVKENDNFNGSIKLILTGDEEGDAVNGIRKLVASGVIFLVTLPLGNQSIATLEGFVQKIYLKKLICISIFKLD